MALLVIGAIFTATILGAEEKAATESEETPMPEEDLNEEEEEEEKTITTLTSTSINDCINNNEFVLIEFFSTDCKYCRQFESSVYKHVGAHYANATPADTTAAAATVVVARINGPTVPEILEDIGVKGFPTLVLFKNTNPIMYSGLRSTEKIIRFVDRIRTVPVVTLIHTADGLAAFRARNPGPVVAFCDAGHTASDEQQQGDTAGLLDEYEGSELKNRFFNLAKRIFAAKDDISFVYVSDPSLIGAATRPAMAMLHPDYADPIVYDLGTNAEAEADERDFYVRRPRVVPKRTPLAMGDWIVSTAVPLVDEISAFNYGRYINSNKPIGWLILREFDETSFSKDVVLKWYKDIAREFKDNFLFVYLNQ